MICPKCHAEYREGFTECSDCKVDLVESPEENVRLSKQGISMLKYGISLLFFSFFQLIVTIISYEFFIVYCKNNGGISGTVISNIHPLIGVVIILEIIIALIVVVWGANQKRQK